MAYFNHYIVGKRQRRAGTYHVRNGSISERGFTYLEVILSFSLISLLFPLSFGFFYVVSTDIWTQLNKHRLVTQFDRLSIQVQRDETNAVRIHADHRQLELLLSDGRAIRYTWQKGKIIRSVKEHTNSVYRGHTILLYDVITAKAVPVSNGAELYVYVANRSASYLGNLFVRGNIGDE
jgi:type II secretory pathway component PulJ